MTQLQLRYGSIAGTSSPSKCLQISIAGAEAGNGVRVHLTQGSISGMAGASPTAAIADTDIGIPADELAKVTKPFYQIVSGLAR